MYDNKYQKILVPVDGSILADLAYQKAKNYAIENGAELVILSAVDTTGFSFHDVDFQTDVDNFVEQSDQFLADYAKDARKDNIRFKTRSVIGNPKNAIIEEVKEEKVDAIFMGASGTNSLTRLFVGSTTAYVIRHTTVDVLVVKTHLDNKTRPTH
ncbi:universal stress protein [Enterococcus nangangensis]|uniref:universal stress protein n=1 Tax=Enterococcus nangangensis TaxID=2559926 RepID=UPI0010F97699|nr:universal stress protein [Enterococcus nangangensis]